MRPQRHLAGGSGAGRWLRALLVAGACVLAPSLAALEGVVVDARSGRPLAGALVSAGEAVQPTDAQGRFRLAVPAPARVAARAPGYLRSPRQLAGDGAPLRIALTPFRPKALYLTVYGIGDRGLREQALALLDRTELNALVIDLKGDASIVPHPSAAYRAAGLGPQRPVTVADPAGLVKRLQQRGLYLIARIVVFKDDRLALAHPHWAVRDAQGRIWRDRESLAWIDPFRREAWAFSLGVAEEAAQLGFDEIQFDYIRFPDARGLRYARPSTEAARVATLVAFLAEARQRLAPYNVFIAADVFGYICWNTNDTQIGQRLEALVEHLDYLSPMLYPSGFHLGIPGQRDPVAAPYPIVYRSLERALARTQLSPLRLRPWLQAFRDYAFDRREFGAAEIRAQIDAAEALGTDGWMLWNARNRYSEAGLGPKPRP